MNTILITITSITVILILIILSTVRQKRQTKEFKIKVATNPEQYFISQGGTKPDPEESSDF